MKRRLPVVQTSAADAMREAHAELDQNMQRRLAALQGSTGASSPCREGCASCCRMPVLASAYELAPIVDALRALPEASRLLVRRQLSRWTKAVYRLAGDPLLARDATPGYMRAGIACPLLDRERCLVYTARPMGCRSHQAIGTDPALCKDPGADVGRVPADDLVLGALTDFANTYGAETIALVRLTGLLPTLLFLAWPLVEASEPDFEAWLNAMAARPPGRALPSPARPAVAEHTGRSIARDGGAR